MPRLDLGEADVLRGGLSFAVFDGPFPAAGGHGGWGGPRWMSMECAASAGSESATGPGLESPSESVTESESSSCAVAREAAAAGPGEFDRAERRAEMQAEREARGLVRREAWSSGCFGVTWHARDGKWQGQFRVDKRKAFVCLLDSEREAAAAVVARQRELGLDPDRRQASEFCGVDWHKASRKWRAKIRIGGKHRHLGYFGAGHPGEVDAALATPRRRRSGLRNYQPAGRRMPASASTSRCPGRRHAGCRGSRRPTSRPS